MTTVEQIQAALAEATPGPWRYLSKNRIDLPVDVDVDEADWGRDQHLREFRWLALGDNGAWKVADCRLIANAPEYLAYLLERDERKDRVIELLRHRAANDYLHGTDMVLCDECILDMLRWIPDGYSFTTGVMGGRCADCGASVPMKIRGNNESTD